MDKTVKTKLAFLGKSFFSMFILNVEMHLLFFERFCYFLLKYNRPQYLSLLVCQKEKKDREKVNEALF
jgi:hypothetical protein